MVVVVWSGQPPKRPFATAARGHRCYSSALTKGKHMSSGRISTGRSGLNVYVLVRAFKEHPGVKQSMCSVSAFVEDIGCAGS
eukprot:247454-Amphidinium_carterae.1